MPRFPTLLLLAALFLPSLAAAEAAGEREARRQAAFARDELARGECGRALKSAESALRLDQGFLDAYLLKAQAYECGEDLDQAAATLSAVLEVGTGELHAFAEQELVRVRALIERTSGSNMRRLGPSVDVPLLQVALDPAPFRERVAGALSEGHCALATAAAEELRRLDPALPDGWMLLGDGLKCAGKNRDAVLAYEQYADRGGSDADKLAVRDELRANLGRLRVRLLDAPGDVIARVFLLAPGLQIEPATKGADGADFADLPTGTDFELQVQGRGLETTRVEVGGLAQAERREISVRPEYVGLGVVAASMYDPELVGGVVLASGGELIPLAPGGSEQVTAGAFEALVGGGEFPARVPLEVGRDQRLDFDPTPYRPSTLTLSSVPAGSSVRVAVVGEDEVVVLRFLDLPAQVGFIDPETGLRLTQPQRLPGLIGGQSGVTLQHPQLGQWEAGTALERGGTNGLEVDVQAMEQTAKITEAWIAWQEEQRRAQRGLRAGSGASAALGAALLGGGLAALVGGAALTGDTASLHLYCKVLEGRDGTGGATCDDYASAKSAREALLVGGGVAAGLGGFSFVLSGVFGSKAQRVEPASGPWDPWNVE